MKIRKFKRQYSDPSPPHQQDYIFMCPGCDCAHGFSVPPWTFNGDMDKPTVRASILAKTGDMCCHSYITDGMIQYLNDCTHALAGQTIELPDFDTYFDRPAEGD